MNIFSIEHEWAKAIEQATVLSNRGIDMHVEIGHYYCELAQDARAARDLDRARSYVNSAIEAYPDNPRALALAADLALDMGDTDLALSMWDKIEAVKPAYLPLVAAKKADVIGDKDRDQAIAYLKGVFAKTGSIDVLRATVQRLAAWGMDDEALIFARNALERKPTMTGLAVIAGMQAKAKPEDTMIKLVADIATQHSKLSSRYQCRRCGFLAHVFTWQCPGCTQWDTFPPSRVDE